jgi:hypothetical protein
LSHLAQLLFFLLVPGPKKNDKTLLSSLKMAESTTSSTAAAPASMTLTAVYTSPTSAPFSTTDTVAAPSSGSVEEKNKCLASLQGAITAVQAHINKELTARMEEDNARNAADAKEEENYGEEVAEED